MNIMNLNYKNPEMFEYRFGRKPKMWTIEQLHELWLRTLERADKRQIVFSACYDEIIKKIPANQDDKKIVYYKHEGRPELQQYVFSKGNYYDGYGYSSDIVKFSKDVKKARDEKIDFIIANKKAYDLGQKFQDLQKYRCNLHHFVKMFMVDMIVKKLREHFEESNITPKDIFKISISNQEYYIRCKDIHGYRHYEFEFLNEVTNESIKMSKK